ncbi:hypothetical protein ABB02_02091 [Clostridiaceae bacterium JG1575]|nr:hypothetical protein ABB02_02091 [Clostridiaceae bacterium JG1575]
MSALPYFQNFAHLVIHIPAGVKHPKAITDPLQKTVYALNDQTYAYSISFDQALNELFDYRNLHALHQDRNVALQEQLLQRYLSLEQEEKAEPFQDQIIAHASARMYLEMTRHFDPRGCFIAPMTLDGTTLFDRFPKALADRLSLWLPDGRKKEIWYVSKLIHALYPQVLYRDPLSIITKRQEDIRMMLVHPEMQYLNLRGSADRLNELESGPIQKDRSFYLQVSLQKLQGMYKMTTREISPRIAQLRTDLSTLQTCDQLSFDDIEYWNGVNRPYRSIRMMDAVDGLTQTLEIPSFGVLFVDLEKI